MSFDIGFVVVLTLVALVVFFLDRFPIAQVSMTLPVLLLAGGVITPSEAVSGFSHPATVTVGAMLAMSLGLVKSGVIRSFSQWAQSRAFGNWRLKLLAMCLVVAFLSPFLNNTAVVAVFLPVFLSLARSENKPPSLYLIPLSFAAMLGGTVSVIGTSTNLIVDGILKEHGQAGFSMFSIAPLGLACLAIGLGFVFTLGLKLLPKQTSSGDSADLEKRSFVMEMSIPEEHSSHGQSLAELEWEEDYEISVMAIRRKGHTYSRFLPRRKLRAGDLLYVLGDPEVLLEFADRLELEHPGPADQLEGQEDARLLEVMLGPESHIAGSSLQQSRFMQKFEAVVLGIRHHEKILRDRLHRVRLRIGDVLLVRGDSVALRELSQEPGMIPLAELKLDSHERPPWWVPVGVLGGAILVATLGWAPILVCALAGVVLMLYLRSLLLREIYEDLQWSVIFLLAGLIPLGTAFENSGATEYLARGVTASLQDASPVVIAGVFYAVTCLMTSVVSNNATAVVLTPLALSIAADLGLPPKLVLVPIMFGASAAFMTPMGYQTNTMVYGPGGYRFVDFVRIGLPLNVILTFVVALLVPLFWS